MHGAGTDAEEVIKNAFGCFDPEATGSIDEDKYCVIPSVYALTTNACMRLQAERAPDDHGRPHDRPRGVLPACMCVLCCAGHLFTRTVSVVQVDEMMRGAPMSSAGQFNYLEFTKILKRGAKDDSASSAQ